jgi:hypothetical protein
MREKNYWKINKAWKSFHKSIIRDYWKNWMKEDQVYRAAIISTTKIKLIRKIKI